MHSHFAAFSAIASLRSGNCNCVVDQQIGRRARSMVRQERREISQCSGARTTRWSDTGPFAEHKHRFLEPKYSGSVAFACA